MAHEPGSDFDEFVRGRAAALLRTAYLLTGDRHAAEDLLQDTLERVYAKWSRISGSPEAYARRALVNGATSRWRSRGRRPETALPESYQPSRPDHAGAVTVRAVVGDALRQLSRQQRAVVVLRYFDDLSEADVAELLGCSVGSVKSHGARGLARLRVALGPTFDIAPPPAAPPPAAVSAPARGAPPPPIRLAAVSYPVTSPSGSIR